jgi:hypothetical protein
MRLETQPREKYMNELKNSKFSHFDNKYIKFLWKMTYSRRYRLYFTNNTQSVNILHEMKIICFCERSYAEIIHRNMLSIKNIVFFLAVSKIYISTFVLGQNLYKGRYPYINNTISLLEYKMLE